MGCTTSTNSSAEGSSLPSIPDNAPPPLLDTATPTDPTGKSGQQIVSATGNGKSNGFTKKKLSMSGRADGGKHSSLSSSSSLSSGSSLRSGNSFSTTREASKGSPRDLQDDLHLITNGTYAGAKMFDGGEEGVYDRFNNNFQDDLKDMADEEVDIDLTDPEVGKAAVKIQAGFKNFMASKKKGPSSADSEKSSLSACSKNKESDADKIKEMKELDEAIADIDLNDPDVEKAATKIQATFRGYKTRKETSNAIEAK